MRNHKANKNQDAETESQANTILQHINRSAWKSSGYVVKLEAIFHAKNIKTVGDLLRFGKTEFTQIRNVGSGCIMRIEDALEELYGIKEWYKS